MYSRSFDNSMENYEPEREAEAFRKEGENRPTGLTRLFSGIKTEDLLLIAIAALLLMDGDPDNDVLLIALAFLLFF